MKTSLPPKRIHSLTTLQRFAVAAILLPALTASALAKQSAPFQPVATYVVSGDVAEIVAATPDGNVLIYTDSSAQEVGFVDITDPANPTELGTIGVDGEPT